jgi:hypothetical protein
MTQTERLRVVSGGRIKGNQSKKLISDQKQAKFDKNPQKTGKWTRIFLA